ncbi:MAG: rhamnan synthesis F family protein [Cyanobacteriota bacterium]|jgi:hypothetical protein
MFRLAADTVDYVDSFPAVIPDFNSQYSIKLVASDWIYDRAKLHNSTESARIMVIIHCHYPDLLEYFTTYLNRIPEYDLIISITSPILESFVSEWACRLKPNMTCPRQVSIQCLSNNGRDVRPFWEIGVEIPPQYTVFLKLHTKSSPQYEGFVGLSWLKDILENLLVDASTVNQIVRLIHSEEYGAVFPVPWEPFRFWGWTIRTNFYHSQDICKTLSINPYILFNPLQYPVGNMYWGSTSIFRSYGVKILSCLPWPDEPLANDGTLLHALERMTGYLYTAQNKKIAFAGCSGSTVRGQGLFSWHIEDLPNQEDQLCETFRPVHHDDMNSSLTGHPSPASSLAFFSSGINASMCSRPVMLPTPIKACTSEANPFLSPKSSLISPSIRLRLKAKIWSLSKSINAIRARMLMKGRQ